MFEMAQRGGGRVDAQLEVDADDAEQDDVDGPVVAALGDTPQHGETAAVVLQGEASQPVAPEASRRRCPLQRAEGERRLAQRGLLVDGLQDEPSPCRPRRLADDAEDELAAEQVEKRRVLALEAVSLKCASVRGAAKRSLATPSHERPVLVHLSHSGHVSSQRILRILHVLQPKRVHEYGLLEDVTAHLAASGSPPAVIAVLGLIADACRRSGRVVSGGNDSHLHRADGY